ncbi:MAG TPA: bifunctional DNA-formamidopyrimidine glycosylase/DNA-(apurinic or apyrimidinic site) lyase [Coriobacteriia bacterium]|nr:bifunctional DNA-formamidopyrimidine glycosylase/DNA-(apurinic or apyrimidinic site) lyase [Coriobacteriia bacterium]
MPELPEVETIRRGLERVLVGRVVQHVEVSEKRSCTVSSQELAAAIVGAQVETVSRHGKLLIIGLDNALSLLTHLRMTGQLIFKAADVDTGLEASGAFPDKWESDFGGGYPNQSFIGNLPDKTTRIIFTFSDGSHLYFNDQRKFGYVKPVPTGEVQLDDFVASLGPEPLDPCFSAEDFAARLPKGSKRSVKSVLLDQSTVTGIGNIYADESLFLARILPSRTVASLTRSEITALYAAIRSCMEQSIADGGSTMKDYVDSEGLRGEYLDLHATVFNRAGLPCRVCGAPIRKTKVAGRGTHYCENCQK